MSPRSSTERVASHGRGGAGNITKDDPSSHVRPTDLVTPTLKSDLYTTGRGGTGNMARNDPNHPEIARAAQDVEAPGHRDEEGPHFYGRGGAANYAKATDTEHKSSDTKQEGVKDKGFVEKIKEKLGSNKD